jgi:hypothetical protein
MLSSNVRVKLGTDRSWVQSKVVRTRRVVDRLDHASFHDACSGHRRCKRTVGDLCDAGQAQVSRSLSLEWVPLATDFTPSPADTSDKLAAARGRSRWEGTIIKMKSMLDTPPESMATRHSFRTALAKRCTLAVQRVFDRWPRAFSMRQCHTVYC